MKGGVVKLSLRRNAEGLGAIVIGIRPLRSRCTFGVALGQYAEAGKSGRASCNGLVPVVVQKWFNSAWH